ncbi:flagellar protein FliT [Pantoea latae]|uniref:Flagellar protein FliT n=1 Tax=Pantoea latae TaxID=1964541 RepID=A0A1V9DNH9_9GAMM|nr:flagellar protein FliT [Pantoea latae]OQP35408.1 hypothetical protein B2J69_05290 [Pantoea latae]
MNAAEHPAMQLSLRLLALQEQQEWEAFCALAPDYLAALEALLAEARQASRDDARLLLRQLQLKDREMTRHLQARLATLSASMARLQQGKTCCQRYAAQMPRSPFPARF